MPRKPKPEPPSEFEQAVGVLTDVVNTLDLCLRVLDDVSWAASILGRSAADPVAEYAKGLHEKQRPALPETLRRAETNLEEGLSVVRKLIKETAT